MLIIIINKSIFLIQPLLEARAEIKKYFRWFFVQMKTLEFAFEIYLPLGWNITYLPRTYMQKQTHIQKKRWDSST